MGCINLYMRMYETTVDDCQITNLPNFKDKRFDFAGVESLVDVPFNIKRIYYLYDIPKDSQRGGHAHKELYQLIIAASGSFDVEIDDGIRQKKITLNKPDFGLMVVPGIWRELINFSGAAVCLVLASEKYDEIDYIRDYKKFVRYKNYTYDS